MALITTGKKLIKDLQASGALGLYTPLEGGHEGRYQRRVRAAGYTMLTITARGLGDLDSYLMNVHGMRPAHLGKKTLEREGAVGYRQFVAPIAGYQLEHLPPKSKGLVIWLLEGNILSQQELQYLISLPSIEPRIKVMVEMGGGRFFDWKPLQSFIAAA